MITVTVLQRIIEQSDNYCQKIVQTVEFSVEITCVRTVGGRFQRIISAYNHSDNIGKNNWTLPVMVNESCKLSR